MQLKNILNYFLKNKSLMKKHLPKLKNKEKNKIPLFTSGPLYSFDHDYFFLSIVY